MKKFLVIFIAVLLIQASLAGKKKKSSSSSSSSSSDSDSGSNEKKHSKHTKKCPACPPPLVLVIKEVTACEGDLKRLTCPAGSTIRVHEAFYGRRNSYTCRYQNGNDIVEMCSSPRALETLSNRCNGRSDCDLSTANTWFTDPCNATYKYLEVSFSCSVQEVKTEETSKNSGKEKKSEKSKKSKSKNRS